MHKSKARPIYQKHPWLLKPAAMLFTLLFPLLLVLKWYFDAKDEGVFDGSAGELWQEIRSAWKGFDQ